MRGDYRNAVFTAVLIVLLVPGIAGFCFAADNTDNIANTATDGSVRQAGNVAIPVETAGAVESAGQNKNATTLEAYYSRTAAKKKGGLGDLVLKPLSYLTYILPASLQGKLAPLAGPSLAARISSFVAPEQAVKVAMHTDPQFMAQCIYYLDPAEGAALLEAAPEDLLLKVAEHVLRSGNYARMAKFADHLSVEKAKSLFFNFRDVEAMLNVAYYMKNIQLLADTFAALPQEYVTRLINDVAREGAFNPGAFEMTAHLSQRLPPEQILQMLEKLTPSDVSNIVIHYPPELLLELMDRFDEDQLTMVMEKMGSQMTPDQAGALFSLSNPEESAKIMENYSPELLIQIFEKMDDQAVLRFLATIRDTMTADQILQLMDAIDPAYLGEIALHFPPELSAKVLTKMDDEQTKAFAAKIGERMTTEQIVQLMEQADPEYVATVVPLCPPEVIEAVLNKMDTDYIARMAVHFPPKLTIQILKQLDDAQARSLAAHIGENWTAAQITGMMKEADPAYIAMVVFNSPPEVVNAVLGKLNDAQLRELVTIATQKMGKDPNAMKIFSQLSR